MRGRVGKRLRLLRWSVDAKVDASELREDVFSVSGATHRRPLYVAVTLWPGFTGTGVNTLRCGVEPGHMDERLLTAIACIKSGRDDDLQRTIDDDAQIAAVPDGDGMTLLHHACRRKQSIAVDKLVSAFPAAALHRDKNGWTPLTWAASRRADVAILQTLIRSDPACARMVDAKGACPLHHAVAAGSSSIESITSLLDALIAAHERITWADHQDDAVRAVRRLSAELAELVSQHAPNAAADDGEEDAAAVAIAAPAETRPPSLRRALSGDRLFTRQAPAKGIPVVRGVEVVTTQGTPPESS